MTDCELKCVHFPPPPTTTQQHSRSLPVCQLDEVTPGQLGSQVFKMVKPQGRRSVADGGPPLRVIKTFKGP